MKPKIVYDKTTKITPRTIKCQFNDGKLATWRREWRTVQMAAPAFEYGCDDHKI